MPGATALPANEPARMTDLDNDGNLARATEVEGYKVLPPCVIYGKIGQGGMGAVYRGRHLNLDIDVAVKCLKPELVGGDDQFVVRFRREARAAAQINHQNVIRVFDVAEDQGLHYLIMELVQGETARERVARKHTLGVGEALEIVYGAALGLSEAHRKGFVHRDIKPDNIMISSSGQVKVADLGLAKPQVRDDHASLLSGTNVVMGTPQYMPPEQWESTSQVTSAADVWALGATLYYLLVGGEAIQKDSLPKIMQRILLQPFPDPRKLRPDVPADVAELCAKATATAVADRYADAQELADAIERLATRRESLRDKDAVPTGQVSNQILSPPPAKTLAKIKFWLDKQNQDGGLPTPPAGPQGTMVVDGAGRTITELDLRRRSNWPWFAGAAGALLVVVLLAAFGPWGRGGHIFAEADRLLGINSYAAAIEETNAVCLREQLGSTVRSERLAEIYAAWARDLAAQGQWAEALLQIERSLDQRATPKVRDQKQALLAKIRGALDARLVREAPASTAVARGAVEFRGKLEHELVQTLRIAGRAVERQQGRFATSLDVLGRSEVELDVVLTNGEVLSLPPWQIVYADAAVPPAAAAAIELAVSPTTLELDDDGEAELRITAPRDVTVRVDGTLVPAAADGTTRHHRVRSAAEQPAALEVVATAADGRETRRRVPVHRRAQTMVWLRPATIDGARLHRQQIVTDRTTVQLVGQVDAGPATVRVDGVEVAAEWASNGVFTAPVTLAGPGQHVLRVTVEKRLCPMLEQDVRVTVLAEPHLELAAPTRDGDVTTAPSYTIHAVVDAWTTSVAARRDGVLLRTAAPQANGVTVRLDVPLQEGENAIDLVAVNAVGRETTRRLTLQRLPGQPDQPPVPQPVAGMGAGGAPRILQILAVADGTTHVVERNRTAFVRSGTRLQVEASDPSAVVVFRDRELAAADLVLQPGALLLDEPLRCELKVRTAAGLSEGVRFGLQLDDTLPEFTIDAPTTPVGAWVPFTVRGSWRDQFGVASITVNGVEATGASNGSRGSWSVELPGVDAAIEYPVVITDRAGNQAHGTIRVEP